MGEKLITALHGELHDAVKYADMAKECEYGSILMDIAREEMRHAKHLKTILEWKGVTVPDMAEDWQKAEQALN